MDRAVVLPCGFRYLLIPKSHDLPTYKWTICQIAFLLFLIGEKKSQLSLFKEPRSSSLWNRNLRDKIKFSFDLTKGLYTEFGDQPFSLYFLERSGGNSLTANVKTSFLPVEVVECSHDPPTGNCGISSCKDLPPPQADCVVLRSCLPDVLPVGLKIAPADKRHHCQWNGIQQPKTTKGRLDEMNLDTLFQNLHSHLRSQCPAEPSPCGSGWRGFSSPCLPSLFGLWKDSLAGPSLPSWRSRYPLGQRCPKETECEPHVYYQISHRHITNRNRNR